MIEQRDCPVCGGQIMIKYITPTYNYYITEDGKIERDTNNDLWEGKDPYLSFCCSNDELHDININQEGRPSDSMQKWKDLVEKEFYERGHDDPNDI